MTTTADLIRKFGGQAVSQQGDDNAVSRHPKSKLQHSRSPRDAAEEQIGQDLQATLMQDLTMNSIPTK